jgi:hypothetical protein
MNDDYGTRLRTTNHEYGGGRQAMNYDYGSGLQPNATWLELPRVEIDAAALGRLWAFVTACPTEVGGLGLVDVEPDALVVRETYVLPQLAGPDSTIIAPEDLSRFLCDLIAQDVDTGRLRLWWHSHCEMPVFWSTQDLLTMTSAFPGADWMLAMVLNRRGDIRAALELYRPVRAQLDLLPVGLHLEATVRATVASDLRQAGSPYPGEGGAPPRVDRVPWPPAGDVSSLWPPAGDGSSPWPPAGDGSSPSPLAGDGISPWPPAGDARTPWPPAGDGSSPWPSASEGHVYGVDGRGRPGAAAGSADDAHPASYPRADGSPGASDDARASASAPTAPARAPAQAPAEARAPRTDRGTDRRTNRYRPRSA